MIALFSRYGRTGNRLVINIHALATALATGQDFFSFFGKEIVDLSGVSHVRIKNSSVRFLPLSTDAFPFRLIGKMRALFESLGLCRNVGTVHDMNPCFFASNRLHILIDWFQRNPEAVHREADRIREILSFLPKHSAKSDFIFQNLSTHPGRPVYAGLHIRRTDYREWRGGEFFWSFDAYRHFMDSFAAGIVGHQVVFVVSSDEKIPQGFFSSNDFQTIFLSGNAFEDMCALSRCDYVMGPRSSFSRIAAFLGNTLYHQIEGLKDPCNPQSFIRSPIP